jgi:hypothetical protein
MKKNAKCRVGVYGEKWKPFGGSSQSKIGRSLQCDELAEALDPQHTFSPEPLRAFNIYDQSGNRITELLPNDYLKSGYRILVCDIRYRYATYIGLHLRDLEKRRALANLHTVCDQSNPHNLSSSACEHKHGLVCYPATSGQNSRGPGFPPG